MTFGARLLQEGALRAADDGFELDVYLMWYQSLPLSSVATVELVIDGEAVPRQDITFVVNGRERALDDLRDCWDEEWFVLDAATLRVRRSPPVQPGQSVEVAARLGNLIPYILVGPRQAMEYVEVKQRTLVAGGLSTTGRTEVQ